MSNVLLTHQLLRGYERSTISPRAMMKLDMMKASDTVNWDSITSVLAKMNFPAEFINWIHACISTVGISIIVNGSPIGYFKSGHGIRQGDPMSAYLFIIIMEILTHMLNRHLEAGNIILHPKCKDHRIVSLMFADDLVVFTKPTMSSILCIMSVLNEFYQLTGLKINLSKSTILTAGITLQIRNEIVSVTSLQHNQDSMSYLGIPSATSRITKAQHIPIFEHIMSLF